MPNIKKLKIDDETIYPVTIPQAVVDPDSGKSTRTELDEKIPKTQNTLLKEPTGFASPELVIVTGDTSTRKVTLSGTISAYWHGEVVAALIDGYLSPAHGTDTTKQYYLSYNGTSIAWSETLWTFDQLQIAIAKYDSTAAQWYYFRECHGLMDWRTHEELHRTIGTFKVSGGTFDGYTLSSTTAAERRPNVAETVIADEDLKTTLPALTSETYTQWHLTTGATDVYTLAAAEIVPVLAANPYYNQFTTDWVQTLMPANSVQSIWIYALPVAADVNSQKYRYLFMQGQWITQAGGASASQILAAVNAELLRLPSELNLNGLLGSEIIAIGRAVIAYTGGNWSIRNLSVLSGNKYSQVGSPSGNFLSVVTTDATLTGNGTLADPLKVVQSYELLANKKTTLADNSDTFYPTQKAVKTAVDAKQDNINLILVDVATENILNPAAVTDNTIINENTGALTTSTSYYTTGFMAVVPGLTYKAMENNSIVVSFRKAVLYDANQTRVSGIGTTSTSVTIPTGCYFIRISLFVSASSKENTGFFLSTVTSYIAYSVKKSIQYSSVSEKTVVGDNDILTKKEIETFVNVDIIGKNVSAETGIDGVYDTLLDTGNTSYGMIVEDVIYNGTINFRNTDINGFTYTNSDDVAPIHIQSHTVGANHGWYSSKLTSAGHGLTSANLGEVWTANDASEWTIMRIDSVNDFTVFSSNSGTFNKHSFTTWGAQTSLTNGVVTLPITPAVVAQNFFPSINLAYKKILCDNVELSFGDSAVGNVIDLIEDYDIYNQASMAENASDITQSVASVNIKNNYRFLKNGISYLFSRCKINHELTFKDIMGVQSAGMVTDGYFYIPKYVDGSLDFTKLVPMASLPASVNTTIDKWESGKIPDRVTQYNSTKTKAVMIGILRDRGVGKDLESYTEDTFEIKYNKIYPHPVSSSALGFTLTNEIFTIGMFRACFEPVGVVDVVILPLENKTMVIIDIHDTGFHTINLPVELSGKLITILDSVNITVHGDIIINSQIELTTTDDYAYVEFEVYN